MYFQNKLKSRIYKANTKSIDSVPLENIGELFKSLVKESRVAYETKRKLIRERLEINFIRRYNDTHEDSYEGDFEFLEADVAAELGPFRSLGSDQLKEFEEAVFDLAKSFNFSKKGHEWFFPQAQAYLVQNLPVALNAEARVDCDEMYGRIWAGDPKLLAIVEIFKISNRGPLLGTMTSPECLDYSKLVPLVLAAYKKYAGIPYSKWTRESLWKVVEAKLADAMLTEIPSDITPEDILAARDEALTVKSGDKMGTKRSATSTYMLYPSGGSLLYGVNTLLQHIICQTWCAHPSNRSKYAILDTNDYDNQNVPPLVHSNVLKLDATAIPDLSDDEVPFK